MKPEYKTAIIDCLEWVIAGMLTNVSLQKSGVDRVVVHNPNIYEPKRDTIDWLPESKKEDGASVIITEEDVLNHFGEGSTPSDDAAREYVDAHEDEISGKIEQSIKSASSVIADRVVWTVYSHTEVYEYEDGHRDNVTGRGHCATLSAAKRAARANARNTLNKATIGYTLNGEEIFREVNPYGITGEWNSTDI